MISTRHLKYDASFNSATYSGVDEFICTWFLLLLHDHIIMITLPLSMLQTIIILALMSLWYNSSVMLEIVTLFIITMAILNKFEI